MRLSTVYVINKASGQQQVISKPCSIVKTNRKPKPSFSETCFFLISHCFFSDHTNKAPSYLCSNQD